MELADIRNVVDAWADEYKELAAQPCDALCADLREPRSHDGRQQSASALPDLGDRHVPDEPAAETDSLQAYLPRTAAACCATTSSETRIEQTRMVCENDDFLALVPWWAVWPFETLVLSEAAHRSHWHEF